MQNNLITIEEIISQARKSGTFLGHGNPKVHLAYLTKIRLLPQAIRRKVDGRIVGCYPEFVLSLLNRIEELKTKGLTYSQIRFQLNSNEIMDKRYGTKDKIKDKIKEKRNWTDSTTFISPSSYPLSNIFNPSSGTNPVVFLLIGLILGFLLAANNNANSPARQQNNQSLAQTIDAVPKHSIETVQTNNPSPDPIYLIAIPEKNLYKLGKTDINYLR